MEINELLAEIERLKAIAYRDDLTKLHNRRYFDEHLADEWKRAIRYHISIAILHFDLNGFKQINDSQGHAAGDDLLRTFASNLKSIPLREHDILARLGGDEFAIALPDSSRYGASRIAEAVQNAAKKTGIGCSVGIASCIPLPGSRASSLIEIADAAMYEQKVSMKKRDRTHAIV